MARRKLAYQKPVHCEYCGQRTLSFFAAAGHGRAWYLCGNPACRRMHEGPAPEPSEGRR